ncbi:glutamate receptor ionotropic, delta-2-like [Homarus americanus]|uniref:glutamate receptor ionotropic, delta-2-like n=1 Tax=Homarus americanus TaxID=6706 RepID=UPI001C496F50|nr:glutamate receptor ionotropic, delta-2-like [Homarus americanus]
MPWFVPVGSWTLTPTGPVVQVQEPLVPDPLKLYADMSGRQLIVTANNNWPFFGLKKLGDGEVEAETGIDIQIMNTLGQFLNFTYHVVSPADGQWGGPLPDGTVSGLIGQVARREAHVAICEITVTESRETVVDFTFPYYLESMTLASRTPAEKTRAFAVFSPFTLKVWLCITVSTVAIGPLMSLLGLMLCVSGHPHYQLRDYSFNMFRNMVTQGNLLTTPHWPLRLMFFFWYLFCFYICVLYSGTLTAVLVMPAYEKPIDNLENLAGAVADGFDIGTVGSTNVEFVFKEATGGIYKEVWGLFNHKDRSKSFFDTPDMGFDQILKAKFVMLNPRLNSEVRAAKRGRHKFYLGRQSYYPQNYGIACNKGAPFIPNFNKMLMRISQAGLIFHWKEQEIQRVATSTQDSDTDKGPSAITLKHLQAAFFILVMGFLVAAVVFGLEHAASVLVLSKMSELAESHSNSL